MILSVFRVVSEQPHYATDEGKLAYDWKERWPWSLEAENLTCAFSRNWFCHSLILENLKAEFLDAYSHSCITWSGECSFGRFNHGGDKLG